MAPLDFPEFTRESLAELGGWTCLRKARAIQKAGGVKSVEWERPLLTGLVEEAGREFHPELNLRSLTFTQNKCQCPDGRRGQVCPHATALILELQAHETRDSTPMSAKAVSTPVPEAPKEEPDTLQSLRIDASGTLLEMRLWLPPNLEAAAARNAVVIRMEFRVKGENIAPEKLFRGQAYRVPDSILKILSFLEALGGGSLYSVIQLKRDQLRFILETCGSEAEIVMGNSPSGGVGEAALKDTVLPMLKEPEQPPADSGIRRSREIRNRLSPAISRPTPPRELLPDNWMVIDGSSKFLSILLQERDHPQYQRCAEWLRSEGFRKEPSNGKWWLRDQHKVLNFLALNGKRLKEDYDPGYTKSYLQRTSMISPIPFRFQTLEQDGQFTLRMELNADGLEVHDIRNALVTGRHYIISGEVIYLLEKPIIDKFEAASRSLGGDPQLPMTGVFEARLSGADLAHSESVLDDLDFEIELPADWKKRSAAIREVGKLEPPPIPRATGARFRTYQLVGTAWLWHLYRNRLGGILADEMGLGKTIQAIGLLLSWKAEGENEGPALVVAPASLLGNWHRELSVWAPELEVYTHHGPGRLTCFDPETFSADICLTSYSTLRNDTDLFQETAFSLAIADEAQHVKNRRSHASRSLRSVEARARFVLTGTPIENSVEDLRALFDFCLPGYLKRPPADARGEDRQWHEKQHLEKAAPYILRRGKALVAPELPEKIEQTVWCELEPEQLALYHAVREKTEQTLLQMATAGASENRIRFTMLTELLRLRQVCADPGLIEPDFPLEKSTKFQTFKELLSEAMDGGHRILVFSQFVKLLKRLRSWLEAEEIGLSYIDGSTRDRLAVCDQFNTDTGLAVCLISLKAGGTGLNLTGADTVIHFDPWWNPAVEDQATDRAHRIGQSRTVTSYKLVTEGTVEDKVLALQVKKSMLLKDLLDESAHQSAKVDLTTLKSLLS